MDFESWITAQRALKILKYSGLILGLSLAAMCLYLNQFELSIAWGCLFTLICCVNQAINYTPQKTRERSNSKTTIKTCKLYNSIERIEKELEHRGYKPMSPLTEDILSPFDSWHYEGDSAIQAALDASKIKEGSKILDVGSGFGGPARYMASKGHKVVALELQSDVHAKGLELTKRCGLLSSDAVSHFNADFLSNGDEQWRRMGQYDLLTSFLVFEHISDKKLLFKKCASLVKPGGMIYIEDFSKISDFSAEERTILFRDVFVESGTLLTKKEYIAALEEAGFENITVVDKRDDWANVVALRMENFIKGKKSFVDIHGLDVYQSLFHFYNAMDILWQGSAFGGFRIYGTKKEKMLSY